MNEEIFKYLEGKMNEQDALSLEQKMQHDEDFKEQVALCKNVDSFMEKEGDFEALRNRVIETNARFEKNNTTNKTKVLFLRWGSAAASVVIATGFTWYMVADSKTPQSIYNKNYSAWNQKNITRGDLKNSDLINWEELYSNHNYPLVIENYNLLDGNIQSSPQISLMLGCALMEQQQYREAINVFNAVDTKEYFLFNADLNWYKGLCYLKTNSIIDAEPLFEALLTDKKYGNKAQTILEKLY